MNAEKQKLLLQYLISSGDLYAVCSSIVRPEYFDPELRNTVQFLQKYHEEYNALPSEAQVFAETGIQLAAQNIDKDKFEYACNSVETFCKRKAMEKAILSSPALLEKEDYGKIEALMKNAVLVSLQRDIGTMYFESPEDHIRERLEKRPLISTKWKEVDSMLDGGLARGEMTLFSANSGVGKSVTMANLSLNLIEQGLNVAYISLELGELMIAERYDMMISQISKFEHKVRLNEVATKINQLGNTSGKLAIKQLPAGTTTNQIRAYLKELELSQRFVPDVILVDYIDLMGANEFVPADDVYTKDKMASQQLRNLGVEYDAIMVTASQQNRDALEATRIHQGHIAGGISKIDTTDNHISIIQNESMKAKGTIAFAFLKTRSSQGVGKVIYLKWNSVTLRITDDQHPDSPITFKSSKQQPDSGLVDVPDGKGLLSLVDSI